MSTNPNQDQAVATDARGAGVEPAPLEPAAAHAPAQAIVQTPTFVQALHAAPAYSPVAEYPPAPAYAPPLRPAAEIPLAVKPRSRPQWLVPAAVGVVGLIVSASLGYLLYSTNTKLEATRHDLAATQLNLEAKNKDLAAEKAQAAYVRMYTNDLGRTSVDYSNVVACDSYSSCRSAAETALSDAQSFQADRQSATVPSTLSSADGMLGDGLSAYITALKDLLSAIASNNTTHIQNGFTEVNDALLSVFKTESTVGNLIQ